MARSKIAELTTDELREMVRDVVVKTLSEVLGDPDEGLELRDEFKARLRRSRKDLSASRVVLGVPE